VSGAGSRSFPKEEITDAQNSSKLGNFQQQILYFGKKIFEPAKV